MFVARQCASIAWVVAALVGCSLTTPLEEFQQVQGGSASAATIGSGAAAAGGSTGGSMPLPEGYVAEVLSDAPVAYWRLGESRGTVAFDDSVMGHDGQYVGPITLGDIGALAYDVDTAATFGGEGQISVDDVLDFNGLAKFTLEAWVKPEVIDPLRFGTIVAKTDYDGTAGITYGYALVLAGSGLRLRRSTDVFLDDAVAPPLEVGIYAHVAGTYDGTTITLYVDGQLVTAALSTGLLTDTLGLLRVGAQGDAGQFPDFFFNGSLDEVAIYDHALTQERIQAHVAAAHAP